MEASTRQLFEDLYVELEKNQQVVQENIDNIEVSNLMSDMLVNIEKMETDQEQLDQNNYDAYLDQRCDDLRNVLIKVSKAREEDLIKHDVELIMMKMLSEFDKADMMKTITKEFRQVNAMFTSEQMLNKLEFNNVYDNFLKIDKKFLRYDDTNVTYRTKIAMLESKGNKLELQLVKFSAYVDEEILTKLLVDDITNRIAFENLDAQVTEMIKLHENEERDMEKINKTIEERAKVTDQKIVELIKQSEDNNNKLQKDTLENIDSKIDRALERIKKSNLDMWAHSIVDANKLTNIEEVRKIIQTIPPVIVDKETSMKKIWEIENSDPAVPKPNLLKARGNVDKFAKEAKNQGEVYEDKDWKTKGNDSKGKDAKDKPNKTGSQKGVIEDGKSSNPKQSGNSKLVNDEEDPNNMFQPKHDEDPPEKKKIPSQSKIIK
jgi:hypothetical protein